MELKTEKSIREYLKTLPDDTIIKYYLDVEFSPFPILVIEEYTRRFKKKTKEQILKDLKSQAVFARKKTRELHSLAKKNKLLEDITREKSEQIIKQARKKGYEIGESLLKKGGILGSKIKDTKEKIGKAASAMSPSQRNLELLAKLAELRDAKIITEREFKEKKKKILEKI